MFWTFWSPLEGLARLFGPTYVKLFGANPGVLEPVRAFGDPTCHFGHCGNKYSLLVPIF